MLLTWLFRPVFNDRSHDFGCTVATVVPQERMNAASVVAVPARVRFVRVADLNTSIMLQQRINVCFGEATSQPAGSTRAVILGRSRDFAKYAFCA